MAELRLIEAICEALHEEMARDPNVVLLGEDVGVKGGVFGASKGLLDAFGPIRVLDTPVSEIAIAGAAIGAAMMGLRPVAEFQFADYMHPAYDQIVNQAATIRWRSVGGFGVPVVFRAPFGGGVKGGVYHSQSMESAYCHVPGLKVVVPATPADGKGLLKSAIRDDDPVVFFEPKRAYRMAPEAVGRRRRAARRRPRRPRRHDACRSSPTASACTSPVRPRSRSRTRASTSRSSTSARSSRWTARRSRRRCVKTGRLLVLHEANKTMGFGAEIAAFAAEELFYDLDAPIVRVAGADCHQPYNAAGGGGGHPRRGRCRRRRPGARLCAERPSAPDGRAGLRR